MLANKTQLTYRERSASCYNPIYIQGGGVLPSKTQLTYRGRSASCRDHIYILEEGVLAIQTIWGSPSYQDTIDI